MFDRDKWIEIWATITRNKTRSVLTAFGVSWGVLMFIILVGFGNGFRRGVWNELEGFATNSMGLICNKTSEPYKGNRRGRYWQFVPHDIDIIKHRVAGVEYVTPFIGDYDVEMVRGNKKSNFALYGVNSSYFQIAKPSEIVYGRVLNDLDVKENRKVCVIGQHVYESLFDAGEDPTGQIIRVGGIYYNVIGLAKYSSSVNIGANSRDIILLPHTTLQRTKNYGEGFWFMMISAKPGLRISDMEEQIKQVVKEIHDISPTDEKAIMSFSAEQFIEMAENVFSGVNLLIWVIGLGALMSGVIGISNIMLVTVRERMREIGIRRALGARPLTIATQIMSESIVLTTIAGLAGFVFGSLIIMALGGIMSAGDSGGGITIVPYISFDLALGAVGVLIVSGLLAGLMPTWKALKIKAIDAIRDE